MKPFLIRCAISLAICTAIGLAIGAGLSWILSLATLVVVFDAAVAVAVGNGGDR